MITSRMHVVFLAGAILSIGACNKAGVPTNNSETAVNEAQVSTDPLASAESAGPASIAHNASIVSVDASGAMKTLREGSNGWTCMPDSPTTPGPDPMCMDANAGKWAAAWMGHKPPPDGVVGMIYMLEGGTDASNTDPYATQPTAQNDWVNTGSHVMIVGSKEILAGYPSGEKPDTSGPYVMWAGTPYAHLMVPVGKAQ